VSILSITSGQAETLYIHLVTIPPTLQVSFLSGSLSLHHLKFSMSDHLNLMLLLPSPIILSTLVFTAQGT